MRRRRPKPVHQMTIAQFEATFPHEEACKVYLTARRFPEGAFCPRCFNTKVYELKSRPWHWQCQQCDPNGYRFSLTVDTIFENTNKPLREWFRVVHLMLTSKKGISALQVQRVMGFGSYETAWSMCHKIRAALIEPEKKLGGIVEVDETWIGGKDYNKHWAKKSGGRGGAGSGKTPIVGAVSRKGNVVARVLTRVTKKALQGFVREVVSDKVSLMATDENNLYDGLEANFPRKSVHHESGHYVIGAVHTNTIEGFWSIFKRGIVGSFHKVSHKYMALYVAEFQFRYNNRLNANIFQTAIEGC